MSDEIIKLPEGVGPAEKPAGIFEHYCEYANCKEWGGWGFGSKARGQHFFCYEHKGEGEQYL